jgi:hypothetical protein
VKLLSTPRTRAWITPSTGVFHGGVTSVHPPHGFPITRRDELDPSCAAAAVRRRRGAAPLVPLVRRSTSAPRLVVEPCGTTLAMIAAFWLVWVVLWLIEQRWCPQERGITMARIYDPARVRHPRLGDVPTRPPGSPLSPRR